MDYMILVKSFFVGLLASSSLGPIFVLTFNRGAIYGFSRGFATAVGACIADGFYFFLGLMGVLTVLEESHKFMFLLDTLGGVLLIILGIYSIKKSKQSMKISCVGESLSIGLTMAKSFILTILNPLVVFFFMFIGVQILPEGVQTLKLRSVLSCSMMVMIGSLSVLSCVALFSSFVGSCISEKKLKIISFVTGLLFLGIGTYFLDHLFVSLFKMYKSYI
jgi:threonine/homoserine/homoserine lactone efflux protein